MVGIIVGGLVGVIAGRRQGRVADIVLGLSGGLVGGSLVAILFLASGAVSQFNMVAAIIAFACAGVLLTIERLFVRPRTA
jgi:uncharacterized membrane protein YeaQ/YmgE (transglycosylase-associated protein family)